MRNKNRRDSKGKFPTMLLYTVLLISITASTPSQQGVQFFKGNFKAAKTEAHSTGKYIFLDAYTEWCGPCKTMSKRVFTNQEVGRFYNSNFINLKVDMEKGEGLFLGRKFGVTAYPTLIYLDQNGRLIKKIEGALDVAEFLRVGKQVAN
jgi:thioredoxin-related protein